MSSNNQDTPRYKATYRWTREGRFGQRRSQYWFILDTQTGGTIEHMMWSRADAVFYARQMNKSSSDRAEKAQEST